MCDLPGVLGAYTIEMMPRDTASLGQAMATMPQPHAIFIPWLADDAHRNRIEAAAAVRRLGLDPVPHVSARRIRSVAELNDFLSALRSEAEVEQIFIIAGDIAEPEGPFADTLSIIRSGLLERHGIRKVGIAGHPDDHPDVATPVLWAAMEDKTRELGQRGLDAEIVTQFSFDADAVLGWLRALRMRDIAAPVRIGIPGPASIKTLLAYARRCGVRTSGKALAQYGLSLGRLIGKAGPDAFLTGLEAGVAAEELGTVHAHMFPFGGFMDCGRWLNDRKPHEAAA